MTKRPTIGDLEHGINVLPEHRVRVAEMAAVTRRSQSTDECFACQIASGCSWCSAYNYQCTGTPDKRVTYICPMHKARVLANAYYWNKLHRRPGREGHGIGWIFPTIGRLRSSQMQSWKCSNLYPRRADYGIYRG
ncbi:MAG: hypothetical protein ACLU3I_11740 [Acutalibacteraceae bacterium]